MAIIWDDILEIHNIRPKGVVRVKFDKYLGGTGLPNKNVTAAKAELVVKNTFDSLLLIDGVHCYIHIYSFPKKTKETNPFTYIFWLGDIGTKPAIFPGCTYWWESPENIGAP